MSERIDRRTFFKAGGAAAAASLAGCATGASGGTSGREDFIRSVQKARLFDLSHVWDENAPVVGVNPPYASELAATHQKTRGQFGDGGQLSFTSETQKWSGQHGAPSIDAIGHIGFHGKLFGGVDAAQATSDPRGLGRSGVGANLDIASYPKEKMVNRGVLLDVARVVQGNDSPLSAGFAITDEHLAETAKRQGVSVRPGDTVLVRTGWGKLFSSDAKAYAGDAAAGVNVAGAKWLVSQKAAVVGADTLTFEVRPPVAKPPAVPAFQVFPVHMLVIAQNGINIIENYWLDEIAAAKEYEFLLVVPPLKLRGGTGSALRSLALVP